MKKISITILAVAAIFLNSCGGGAKTENSGNDTATQTEQQKSTESDTNSGSSDLLSKYEEFVNKAVPLAEKVKAGDAAAVQEYTTLAQELAKFTQDNQAAFSSLSPADTQKYTELTQKLADAFNK